MDKNQRDGVGRRGLAGPVVQTRRGALKELLMLRELFGRVDTFAYRNIGRDRSASDNGGGDWRSFDKRHCHHGQSHGCQSAGLVENHDDERIGGEDVKASGAWRGLSKA